MRSPGVLLRSAVALLTACLAASAHGQEPPPQAEVVLDEPVEPRWFAAADLLWLSRDYPGNFQIARTIDRNATQIPGGTISSHDISDNRARPGLRVIAGYRLTDQLAVEAGYLGLQEWSGSASFSVQDPPFAQSPFLGTSIPFANKGFDTTFRADYDSRIHGGELNVRRAIGAGPWRASVLGGFRYFGLFESLELTGVETFTTTVERTRVRVNNNLFGGQLGGELSRGWYDDRITLGINGKVGIFANAADLSTVNRTSLFAGGGSTVLDAGRGTTDVAGMFEAGVTASVRLTRNVTLRGGYQLLLVEGVARAPDQLSATGSALRDFPRVPFPAGTGSRLSTDGDILLHGPSVGLQVSY